MTQTTKTDKQDPPSGGGWWIEEFDKSFSFLEDVSLPIGGAHYGLRALDGLGEQIKSFISHVASTEYERGKRETLENVFEVINQVEKENDSNGRFNACQEIRSLLNLEQKLRPSDSPREARVNRDNEGFIY